MHEGVERDIERQLRKTENRQRMEQQVALQEHFRAKNKNNTD